jgi:hypothetical protein
MDEDERATRARIEELVRAGMAEWGPRKETFILLTDGDGTPLPEPRTFCFGPDGLKCVSVKTR